MSRKPSFAHLRDRPAVPDQAPVADVKPAIVSSRQGRKQIAGFFTPDMSLAMHLLARRQDRTLQALMTEAFDDVLRKYGESPIGS